MVAMKVSDVLEPVGDFDGFPKSRIVHLAIERRQRYYFCVDLNRPNSLPQPVQGKDIEEMVRRGDLHVTDWLPRCTQIDPDALSERAKTIEKQSRELLRPLLQSDSYPKLFSLESRWQLIRDRADEAKCSPLQIVRVLHRYFRNGMSLDRMAPDFRSTKGVPQSGGKRRGRPKRVQGGDKANTVILTPEKRRQYIQFIRRNAGKTRKDLQDLLLKQFFSVPRKVPSGEVVPVSLPAHECLTDGQFRYLVRQANIDLAISRREIGASEFSNNFKALKGKTWQMSEGPGDLYSADGTGSQLTLVSEAAPDVPLPGAKAYFVVDVWSKMIVGFYLFFGEFSWANLNLCLHIAFTSKVEFCARYGIKITDDDWPCIGVPRQMLWDNGGENRSDASMEAARSLIMDLIQARAHQGSDKGDVESLNKAIKLFFQRLPGYKPKKGFARSLRKRLKGGMTMYEWFAQTIPLVLERNRRPLDLESIPAVARGQCEPTPIALWKWGIANRVGPLFEEAPRDLYPKLLPKTSATIRGDGIHVNGFRYTSDELDATRVFSAARLKGTVKIDVRHHNAFPDRIWAPLGADQRLMECQRIDPDGIYYRWTPEDAPIERVLPR